MKRLAALLGLTATLSMFGLQTPARAQEIPIDQMTTPQALDFMRGLLIAGGKVVFRADFTDTATGQTWSHDWSYEIQDVSIEPANCILRYHYASLRDGARFADGPAGVDFRQVDAVSQEGEVSGIAAENARNGHTSWRAAVTPEVWTVRVFRTGGSNSLRFYSRTLADQTAETAARLRALCRAG